MKHPFSMDAGQVNSVESSLSELNDQELKNVSGGIAPLGYKDPAEIFRPLLPITTYAIGEEGGIPCKRPPVGGISTKALGEEGGCHPFWWFAD